MTTMAWWEIAASAVGGGVAKHAFDWLKARGQQQVDTREQLDAALSAHLDRLEKRVAAQDAIIDEQQKRIDALLLRLDEAEARTTRAEERAAIAETALVERTQEWDAIVQASREYMAERERKFAEMTERMRVALAQAERNANV